MANAWMIRDDGKEFPVQTHIYGDEENIRLDITSTRYQETLDAAIWLMLHTNKDYIKEDCKKYISHWIDSILPTRPGNRRKYLYDALMKKTVYKGTTPWEEIINYDWVEDIQPYDGDIKDEAEKICHELDQTFLRARAGDILQRSDRKDLIYFRVSSVGFNWYNIIWKFAMGHNAEYVTVVRDEESTGSDAFYKIDGELVDQMPIEEFFMAKGKPTIEGFHFGSKNILRENYKFRSLTHMENQLCEGSYLKKYHKKAKKIYF